VAQALLLVSALRSNKRAELYAVVRESRDVSAVKPENIVSEDRLLEFFESRAHRGRAPDATASTHHRHPTCGDEIELSLAIEAGTLQTIRFEARGCVVSQAAAAMLCEHLEGKPLAEVNAITPRDMLALVGLPLSPRRLGCALLAYEALRLLEPFAAPPPAPPPCP
jgi:nitrogen fixation protein NifU and related proteins